MSPPADNQPSRARKVRTRTVVEIVFKDISVVTTAGPCTAIMEASNQAKVVKMVADLDARTISVACVGKKKITIPFENCKYWSYGAGAPSAE